MEQLVMQMQQSADVKSKYPVKKSKVNDDKQSDFGQALEEVAAYNAQQPKAPEASAQPESTEATKILTVESFAANQLAGMMDAAALQDLAKIAHGMKFVQMTEDTAELAMINPEAAVPAAEGMEVIKSGIALNGNWNNAEGEALGMAPELLKAEAAQVVSHAVNTQDSLHNVNAETAASQFSSQLTAAEKSSAGKTKAAANQGRGH